MHSIDILEQLIAFDTISAHPNRPLIDHVCAMLDDAGIAWTLVPEGDGAKTNLYATTGPGDRAAVLLSGHVDVVPVAGQDWTLPAFSMTRQDGRLYGRGTADMKGFCASAIAIMLRAAKRDLAVPLHLALSYDEEIGCMGVRSLIEVMKSAPIRPRYCIVGEPTSMQVATGHKGKVALRATCNGREGHSAMAPLALNALHLAADFITALRGLQAEVAATGPRDDDYGVPYTTLHAGKMNGGVQVNIVANSATVDFEIRSLAEDDPEALIAELRRRANAIAAPYLADFPEAAIRIDRLWDYPGLATARDAEVVDFTKSLIGGNGTIKVAFGTEGGLFDRVLGIPTVICGPGSMDQGHKPDEFVSVAQMKQCDAMLAELLDRCTAGF